MERDEEAGLFAFLSEDLADKNGTTMSRRGLAAGLVLLAAVLAAAIAIAALLIAERRGGLESELDTRLGILAEGRARVLGAWLEGRSTLAGRIADSGLFRLFATEMALAGGDLSEAASAGSAVDPEYLFGPDFSPGDPLAAQIPYMEQILSDFARETGFLGAVLIGPRGTTYVRAGAVGALSAAERGRAAEVLARGGIRYGPARAAAAGLVMELYLPVFPVQAERGEGRPAAVLLLTDAVSARFAAVLAPRALADAGERLAMIQEGPGGPAHIAPGASPPLRPLLAGGLFDGDGAIPFGRRAGLGIDDAGGEVYSVGASVPGTPWWIVQQIDFVSAGAALAGFTRAAVAVAGLLVAAVAAAFAAFWWRLAEGHSRALARQFRGLAARIEGQRRLLESINGTIADYIGLKDLDGTYRYVNSAFAKAADRPAEKMLGLDDSAIFGRGTASLLEASDGRALERGRPTTSAQEVFLGGRRRHLQISKAPFPDEKGEVTAIVSVARDVTELVEEQLRKERTVQQMVDALVRAVELRDPYLAGHSKRVAAFAVETARRLGADEAEIATVEIAARLSQIGKLAIPRELLNKTERLDAMEIARMQSHMGHAVRTLEGIDFELPVLETIGQMHERLDGSGYPEGLAGGRISRSGRILAVCDVLCARVEPRSYRPGIAPEEAVEILGRHPEHYDAEAVAALGEVVASVAGEKLIAGIPGG